MPIRTAEQYLESLRDDRQIYIDGERVKDVTRDIRFAGAAETMADLLQMQHDKDLHDVLSYNSPTSGERVGMSHIQPKTRDDVQSRGDAMQVWMDSTCGMLGRSPDYKNVMVAAWAGLWGGQTRGYISAASSTASRSLAARRRSSPTCTGQAPSRAVCRPSPRRPWPAPRAWA